MQHRSFLKSVAVITVGSLVAKGIGALYRIPLMGILGGYGMGLYHMAYPLFLVLLTFSSAGIPSAFSRMIARERAQGVEDGTTVKTALKLFALLGLLGSVLMCLFAPQMASLQGDEALVSCYFALSPSVFLVALIAVFRGYFQGKNDMSPTAFSEIVEQIFKASAGLLAAYRFRAEPQKAVACALAAVTLSELCALCYLVLRYRGEWRAKRLRVRTARGTEIISSALPVMAAAALLPLSQTVDSIVVVRLLARHTARAVSLYGLFSGGALGLINLPATVCCGLAAASVPAVSSCFARGEEEEGRKRAVYALALTLALAIPCALGLYFLAGPAADILYLALSKEDRAVLVSLIRLVAVSAATLAGVETLAASLTGMGKAKYAAFSMLVAVVAKFVLQFLLVGSARFSILGAGIAANACYLIAFSLDLFYTVKKAKAGKIHDHHRWSRRGRRRSDGQGARRAQSGGQSVCADQSAVLKKS